MNCGIIHPVGTKAFPHEIYKKLTPSEKLARLRAIVLIGFAAAIAPILAQSTPPSIRSTVSDASVALNDTSCSGAGPKGCLELALKAMGGKDRLENVKSLSLETILHTALMEQSYRQAPFITAYERRKILIDLVGMRVYRRSHLTWPESDPGHAESDATLIGGTNGGVIQASPDRPCSLDDLDWMREILALGPARLLLTASEAKDLRFSHSELIRGTTHLVLSFTWEGVTIRIAINPFTHLPDAMDSVEEFHDHWYHWGDVRRRLYFENWQVFHGLVYPTNEVEERNGAVWQSTQVLDIELNAPIDEAQFKMDAQAAQRSAQSKGWEKPFSSANGKELVAGLRLYENAWNSTLVKQPDGIVILEAPLSGTYTQGLIDEAARLYPGVPVKTVLSTSDSWPHVGGVRQAVALGVPIYILDLNKPLLNRIIYAPHKLHPDLLAQSPKFAELRIVSQKVQVGTGENRIVLYPIRGASTERQYMVYFPEHHLLYVSDTLSLDDHNVLYDPELMREVVEAVKREQLQVNIAFAMHQGPTPWNQIVSLVEESLR